MVVAVYARGFVLTEALLLHVTENLDHSLGWAKDRLARIEIRLRDINGPHGGEDKLCRAVVQLRSSRRIVVESVSRDLYTAIAAVASRSRDVVTKQIRRSRERRRSGGSLRQFPHPGGSERGSD